MLDYKDTPQPSLPRVSVAEAIEEVADLYCTAGDFLVKVETEAELGALRTALREETESLDVYLSPPESFPNTLYLHDSLDGYVRVVRGVWLA